MFGYRRGEDKKLGNREILVDTSIIIDYLRKQKKEKALLWKLLNQYECIISTVTVFELYSGAKSSEHREAIDDILEFVDIIDFDSIQAKISSDIFQKLKKENQLIEFRDIFIASCAISQKLSLVTFNTDHFIRIEELPR